MPKIKNFRPILTEEEVIQMIQKTPNVFYESKILQIQSFISFLWLSGVRVSEALMLKRQDFWTTENPNYLNIRVPILKMGTRKNQSIDYPRILFFPVDSKNISFFLDFITEQVLKKNKEEKIWSFDRRRAWDIFQKLGFKVYPHLFRHTRATFFAEKNISGQKAKAWFGWKDSATYDKYTHNTKNIMIDLAKTFED